MDILVTNQGVTMPGGRRLRCALGRGGIAVEKQEGDGVTPVGRWPMRRLYYRADRIDAPDCAISATAIDPDDGWCDDPAHRDYNRLIRKPFDASHEDMWREDHLYDLVVVLGHNDDPPVPGAGSAIFLHVAKPDYGPTEGCVALSLPDLLDLLKSCGEGDCLNIETSD